MLIPSSGCVLAPGCEQNSIKLVAMNLIASGRLMEGVELLCTIGNGLDACRYLQTHGKWKLAARCVACALGVGPKPTVEAVNERLEFWLPKGVLCCY